ncbi:MAG TPA: hypothetical protein VGJ97_04950 [Anaerolineaceae bacterium]
MRPTTRIFLLSTLLISLWAISACAPSPTPAPAPKIERAKAIEIATGGCSLGHLHLVSQPENITARLMSLQDVEDLFRRPGDVTHYTQPMDTSVWLVQMEGDMLVVGGPLPVSPDGRLETPTPAQPFRGTCAVTLDADTGDIIEVRG